MAVSTNSGISAGVNSTTLIDGITTTAAALDLLGGGTVGIAVFGATTTAAAQNTLGGTTLGKALFQSSSTAAAQNLLETGAVGLLIWKTATTAAAQAILGVPTFATTAQATAGLVESVAMSPVLTRNFVDSYSGTVGLAVFQATTTVAAQNTLGGTAIGKGLFEAATTAAAQTLLEATTPGLNLFKATTTAAQQNFLEAGTVGLQVWKTTTTAAALNALGGSTLGKDIFGAATTAAAQTLLELNFAAGSIIIGGQGGGKLEASNIKASANTISQYQGNVVTKTDSYALVSADTGSIIIFDVASAAVLTCPKTMPVGFCVEVIQHGSAQVTFTAATSAAILNRSSQTKTNAQNAAVRLLVVTNSDGTNAQYNLAGDTGA